MNHPPVEITIRLEGLDPIFASFSEKSFKFDETFQFDYVKFIFEKDIKNHTHYSAIGRRKFADSIYSIFEGAKVKFEEISDASPMPTVENIENLPFFVDPMDFSLSWDSASQCYLVQNQGIPFIKLSPLRRYKMIISERMLNDEAQRKDLLFPIVDPKTSRFRYNIFVDDKVLGKKFHSFERSLAEFFPEIHKKSKISALIGEAYVEVSYESLLEGKLKEKSPSESIVQEAEHPFLNFMVFKIEKAIVSIASDEAVPLSFDVLLKKAGETEKDRLKSCIKMVHRLQMETDSYFLAPFLNVCQSSGSGKSKIAAELMLEVPSSLVVLRERNLNSKGHPDVSALSMLFMNVSTELKDDADTVEDFAPLSIVGLYVLLLKSLLSDFFDAFKQLLESNNRNLSVALKELYKMFFDDNFFGADLTIYSTTVDWTQVLVNTLTGKFSLKQESGQQASEEQALTIKVVSEACSTLLAAIDSLYLNSLPKPEPKPESESVSEPESGSFPFVLTIDEASFMSLECTKTGVSLFRLFRRAVNCLSKNSNIVVLTLGTNSDILDLNPEITNDSFRFDSDLPGRIFPPFIISRNWDIFLNYEEMIQHPIGYEEMVCGRVMLFWMSLGRPVWGSISFSRMIEFIERKISNSSLETGEAYLAFWMVRVGLLVHPAHIVTKHLVKSLMATLMYTSHDLSSMRACYPSEPALAVGARSKLRSPDEIIKYYEALEKFVDMRAIDTGRFSEIISADICLLAIAEAAEKDREVCNWNRVEGLPGVCQANSFIFEEGDFHLRATRETVSEIRSKLRPVFDQVPDHFKSLDKNYMIVRVDQFVRYKYGAEVFRGVGPFLPESIKSARLNTSHFTQMGIKFPFDSLYPLVNPVDAAGVKNPDLPDFNFVKTEAPIAVPKYSKVDKSCCQVTAEVLESMIMRGSGAMFAPNTFGLDYQFPVCMKPDAEDESTLEDLTRGLEQMGGVKSPRKDPEYSYIGVQVKRGVISNIRPIVAKGAVSNHYVRCGLHGGGCSGCEFRVSDRLYKKILENGLIFVHSMEGDDDFDAQEPISEASREESASKKPKTVSHEIMCETQVPGSDEIFTKLAELAGKKKEKTISQAEFDEGKEECYKKLRLLVSDLCPPEYWKRVKDFEFQPLKTSHFDNVRFTPDLYLSLQISSAVSLHCMVKRHSESGILEKLTAIHSRGLKAFSTVLPSKARRIAKRVIFNERSMFDEIPSDIVANSKPSIKYSELVSAIVARNNGSAIPVASNYIRTKYDLPVVPPLLPKYKNVSKDNIKKML